MECSSFLLILLFVVKRRHTLNEIVEALQLHDKNTLKKIVNSRQIN